VDITFWVIQALLLTPVLFMAASVGMEGRPTRSRRAPPPRGTEAVPEEAESDKVHQPVAAPSGVVLASSRSAASLSGFTAEQQARLVVLRSFVQQARSGHGALSDDMAAEPEVPEPPRQRRRRARVSLSSQQVMLVGGILLVGVGLVGIVRTSMAMDDLQRNSVSQAEPLTPAARLLPGVIVNPAKYLSAVNASASAIRGDPLYAVGQMELKQAMDRWEALAGVGLSLILFFNAMRASEDEESSVAFDLAPFILVAAALFAGLSFFELP
jgi:hypothetical protein